MKLRFWKVVRVKLVMLKQYAEITYFSFTFPRDRVICKLYRLIYISSAIFEWSETASDARVSSNDHLSRDFTRCILAVRKLERENRLANKPLLRMRLTQDRIKTGIRWCPFPGFLCVKSPILFFQIYRGLHILRRLKSNERIESASN